MIHFEITKSTDNNVISEYQFFQNQIYLGRGNGDLWINDSSLMQMHVMLEVIENELLIHPQKSVESYQINGKRCTTVRKIKINDIVTIGNTQIKIITFSFTNLETKKDVLDQRLQELINQKSPLIDVVEKLTLLMKS